MARCFDQGDQETTFKTAFESSPEAALSHWTSPVLLITGDDDRNVPFDQTVDLAAKLREQGTPFQELIQPDEIHGFLRYHSWLKADTAMANFLDETLKP